MRILVYTGSQFFPISTRIKGRGLIKTKPSAISIFALFKNESISFPELIIPFINVTLQRKAEYKKLWFVIIVPFFSYVSLS